MEGLQLLIVDPEDQRVWFEPDRYNCYAVAWCVEDRPDEWWTMEENYIADLVRYLMLHGY